MEFEKMQEIIAEVLSLSTDEITLESEFVNDLGADSLDLFEIITILEDEFDIEIEDVSEDIVTVGDALEQIKQAINE